MLFASTALLCLPLVGTAACESHAESKTVLARISRMRDAPVAERSPHIRALKQMQPSAPLAASARRACLEAYEKLQSAHDEINQASARLTAMQSRGEKPRYEEVQAADRATTQMLEAKKALPSCTEAVVALQRSLR